MQNDTKVKSSDPFRRTICSLAQSSSPLGSLAPKSAASAVDFDRLGFCGRRDGGGWWWTANEALRVGPLPGRGVGFIVAAFAGATAAPVHTVGLAATLAQPAEPLLLLPPRLAAAAASSCWISDIDFRAVGFVELPHADAFFCCAVGAGAGVGALEPFPLPFPRPNIIFSWSDEDALLLLFSFS